MPRSGVTRPPPPSCLARVDRVELDQRPVGVAPREHEEAGELARRRLDRRSPAPQQRRVGLERHRGEHDVAHLVGVQLDRGDDPEVPAGAADGPQQVGAGVGVGAHERAVGEHELRGDDVVDREAVPAGEEADAAGRREPADADVAVVAGAHPQPVRSERLRDVAPARAGTEPDAPGRAVEHLDPVEPADVDDDAAVVGGAAADAVAAAADRQHDVLRTGVRQRGGDVLGRVGTDHEAGRAPADVRRADRRVRLVAGLDRLGRERRGQRVVVDALTPERQGFWVAHRSRPGAGGGAGGRDRLAQRRRDLPPELLDRARVVARDDERAEPVLEHERQQLLDPLLGRPLEEPAALGTDRALDVEQPSDRARVATGRRRGLVDGAVRTPEVIGRQVAERGQPAPSALRPVSRSMRGLYAPSQIAMSCAGSGPRLAPRTRQCSPSTRTPARSETSQMPRMMSIASSSASTA
jgi:hypothetical protein